MNIKQLPTSSNRLKNITKADIIKIDKVEDLTHSSNFKRTDNVSVSSDHRLMEEMKQELANVPDVDMEKVFFIKNALKNGTFELDIDKITEVILAQHSK